MTSGFASNDPDFRVKTSWQPWKARHETKGESRRAGVRVLISRPLGVEYEVTAEDHTVYVLSVWTTQRPSQR